MVLVNYSTRELTAKLVYYGPGLCGKTTNLQYVYDSLLPPDRRGKMVSLSTETDRTLFFDFLPLELGTIRGLKTRLQLYTVPGQVHYNATRKIVLKGADGIVFVADSQASKREGNIESYRNMKANLTDNGLDLRNIPHVLQFNKRDLADLMSIDQLVEDLNEYNAPFFEAIAFQGIGVEDTLKGISKLVLKNLAGRFQPGAEVAQPAAAPAPTPAPVIPSPAETVAAPAPVMAPPAPVMAPPAPVMAPPAPAWPAPAAAGMNVTAVSGDLEDMLLGAPEVAPHPTPAMSNDVFGFGAPAAPLPQSRGASPSDDLENMLLAEPMLEPEPPELELPTADEEALLRGDTVLSADMMSPLGPLTGSTPAADNEFAFNAGDTIMSPMPPMSAPTARDFEFDAALLSGDTVMSPSASEPLRPLEDQVPPPAEPEIEPIALDAGDELSLSADDEIPLASDEVDGPSGMDLEESLLSGPRPVMTEAPAVPAIDIPVPIQLGHAQPGAIVERILRVPLEYTDATGQRRTTLEVTLRFRLS